MTSIINHISAYTNSELDCGLTWTIISQQYKLNNLAVFLYTLLLILSVFLLQGYKYKLYRSKGIVDMPQLNKFFWK